VRAVVAPPSMLPLERALGLGPALRIEAEREQAIAIGAAVFDEHAIVLGRMQRAGRLLDAALFDGSLTGLPRVWRRSTTGAHAYFEGEAMLLALALPSLDAVFRDAEPRSLLNRNLRLFLRAFASAGLAAAYFGRDFLSVKRVPFALVGFDVSPAGTVLIELFVRRTGSLALPQALSSDLERATTRFAGKAALGTRDLGCELPLVELAERVIEGVVERADATVEPCALAPLELPFARVVHERSPLPEDAGAAEVVAAPIGWIDLARTPRGVWVGGDVLAPVHALGEATPMDAASAADLPIDGALWDEVLRARDALRR
jgi:hypothetical protein